ncbi:hypothetical protein QFZ75_001734 [Streptomyces sp. V3I8]|nr:hypothetical protein [Streptomyces sp. V3I8]
MAESVPVVCPACRREHVYAAPAYPCVCGAPVAPLFDVRARPESVTHHTWDEDWVTIPCTACGRADQWPRPELGCPCGTLLRVPLAYPGPAGPDDSAEPDDPAEPDEDAECAEHTRSGARAEPGPGAGFSGPSEVGGHAAGPGAAAPDAGHTPRAAGSGAADAHAGEAPRPAGHGNAPDAGGADIPRARRTGDTGTTDTGTAGSGVEHVSHAADSDADGPGSGGGGGGPGSGDTGAGSGSGRGRPVPRPRRQRLPAAVPLPRTEPAPRAAFQPVTIRTARDAVTAAALYLRWLGYRDIRRADQRPPSGIGLAARGIVAQVDPTVRPASPRDVECLWLTAMTESAGCVYFSLAGYEKDARTCADSLGVPLFVLDLTGTPQPANNLAGELAESGA